MARNVNEDYARHSPDKLLNVFVRSRIFFWCVVATAVHFLALLATSSGYIRDRWIDPEGAAARKAGATNIVAKAEAPPPAAADTNTVNVATNVAEAASTTNATVVIDGQEVPADRTNAAVLQRITAVAKPEEIPATPNDLGISLEDTSIK
jgi:hypothetical protein